MMKFAMANETKKVSHFLLNLQVNSDEELDNMIEKAEELSDAVEAGDTEFEPLLSYILWQIEKYEDTHYPIEEASPVEMLKFYMDQNGHKQKDLTDIASKSVISEVLNGKRDMSKRMILKLAEKYHTDPAVFL